MRTELNEALSYVSITELYDNISMKINGKKASQYDCRKVRVGESVMNAVQRYYGIQFKNQNKAQTDFAMNWLCYGPKATLNGYEVEVEEGWCEL